MLNGLESEQDQTGQRVTRKHFRDRVGPFRLFFLFDVPLLFPIVPANSSSKRRQSSRTEVFIIAAAYIRVSTADQNTELQIRNLRAYAERQGW